MGQSEQDIQRPGLFSLLNILSLDVAAGAFAWAWMLNGFRFVGMPPFYFVILPLAVWVIYTADHLLDAYRLKESAHTPRHRFHYRYFKPILAVWILGMGACLVLSFLNLPKEGIYLGLLLGGLTLLHLALVRWMGRKVSPFVLKEFAIAAIYTAGIWGLPYWLYDLGTLAQHLEILQFFLLALVNLLLFSIYEYEVDEQDGHGSFVRGIGKIKARTLIAILLLTVLVLAGVVAYEVQNDWLPWDYMIEFVISVMALIFGAMLIFPTWFGKAERYRLIGDGIYLLPLWIGLYLNFLV